MRSALPLLVVLIVGTAAASVALTYTTTSALTTSVTPPPVHWVVGSGGTDTRHFSPALATSANRTTVSGTLVGHAGAFALVKDAVRLTSASGEAHSVTLTATRVTSASVEHLTWTVLDGATPIGTLDVRAVTPTLTLSLPAGASYALTLRADLADGAGLHNTPSAIDIELAIDTPGTVEVDHATSTLPLTVRTVEDAFGRLAAGSAVGLNATNATATIAGAVVLSATTNLFYLNNTNASGAYFVKLVATSSSGLTGATTINIGVQNTTTSTDHIKVANGALTQSSGSYVRLEPSSTNRIYATTLVSALYGTGVITFDAYLADDAAESAYYLMRGQVTVT